MSPRICEQQQTEEASTLIRILRDEKTSRVVKLLLFRLIVESGGEGERLIRFRDVSSLLIPLKTSQVKKREGTKDHKSEAFGVDLISEASSASNWNLFFWIFKTEKKSRETHEPVAIIISTLAGESRPRKSARDRDLSAVARAKRRFIDVYRVS